jgi:propionyl-CoA carboxylase alpha chain
VRLYAEDPAADYAPQTGVLREFTVPLGPGVRVDSAVETGSEVGIHYDAMIAKVIAHGPDRTTALRTLDGALRRARIHGLITNRDLLRAIITDDEFVAGRVHTALLDQRIDAWTAAGPDVGPAVVAAAVASAVEAAQSSKVLGRIPTAYRNVRSQPRVRTFTRPGSDEELAVSYVTERGQFVVEGYAVVEAGASRVVLDKGGVQSTYEVRVGAVVDVDGPEGSFSFVPVPTFIDPSDAMAAGSLLAPMPASVTVVAVEAGQQVAKGDVIVVLEAMKMQHTITAPSDGVVAELDVSVGQQVESGAVLAVIEAPEGEGK